MYKLNADKHINIKEIIYIDKDSLSFNNGLTIRITETEYVKILEDLQKSRYEIVLEKDDWYKDNYIGPWANKVTYYDDFKEALELISEWGRNSIGEQRKRNKIGIYDHKEDEFYSQDRCFKFEEII